MKLIVTIDTEEDSWGNYHASTFSTKNIGRLPALEELFAKYDVRATYLASYPVVTRDDSLKVLSDLASAGRCEIGAHCHPWNTPPLAKIHTKAASMLSNLPVELQYRKLRELDYVIQRNLNIKARSFRAGRWAFDRQVARSLIRLKYTVDTSVTPFVSWAKQRGRDHRGESPLPSWLEDPSQPKQRLLEIPATVGFLQHNQTLVSKAYELFCREQFRPLRLLGLMDRMGLMNRVWLSPELSTLRQMTELTRVMVRFRPESQFLNFTFHSPSLYAGLTPFVKDRADEMQFLRTIEGYLKFVAELGIESIRLKDAAKLVSVPDDQWTAPEPMGDRSELYGAVENA